MGVGVGVEVGVILKAHTKQFIVRVILKADCEGFGFRMILKADINASICFAFSRS